MTKKVSPEVSVDELTKREDLTVPEAAQLLRSSNTLVYKLIDQGKLKAWRVTDGKTSPLRVYTESVLNYIRKTQGRSITQKKR